MMEQKASGSKSKWDFKDTMISLVVAVILGLFADMRSDIKENRIDTKSLVEQAGYSKAQMEDIKKEQESMRKDVEDLRKKVYGTTSTEHNRQIANSTSVAKHEDMFVFTKQNIVNQQN